MIRRDIEEFAADVPGLVDAAQHGAVVISRAGEPVARLLGIRGKDWEDLELESSPEFWRMIEHRRKHSKTITSDEMWRRLGLGPRKPKAAASARRRRNGPRSAR